MISDVNRRFLALAGFVIVGAVIALPLSLWQEGRLGLTWESGLLAFVVLALLVVISEVMTVAMPLGNISLAYPLSVAALTLLGPSHAAVMLALSQIPSLFGARRVEPIKVAFNAGQMVLAVLTSGWVYMLASNGTLLLKPDGQSGAGLMDFSPRLALAIFLVSFVGVVVNFGLAGTAVHFLQGVSLRRIWLWDFSAVAPSQVALGLVGVAMAQVVAAVGIAGLLLFVVPLMVARSTYLRYAQVHDAYAGTIRSLVAAIEAKDPYTKGHSVRVASYCVLLAKQLGLSDRAVERLEYAALLHDLGKVGIPRSILSKPDKLTEAEYAEIRRHPDIGAHIIDSVPYLEDLVGVVRHHHERYDGQGYGHSVAGEAIPLPARIMAVADAYDAMTSERPYRGALEAPVALAELRDGAGTQFDPRVVEAFQTIAQRGISGSTEVGAPQVGAANA